ncbi:hypothetical protein C9374_012668 [Naegleria lovaniensis]|uniref:Uncharacterized protein n=1 Tax=Naegleria lovaniensis TaxID=51637 RepID=A0AA88H1M9_NAELO|nr:uncharacterized protein C9374_012668 [Naegleria lovaniensis]KAG2392416.1 hypothetical protein C9374_012668 [Naegleria lovaniensis]
MKRKNSDSSQSPSQVSQSNESEETHDRTCNFHYLGVHSYATAKDVDSSELSRQLLDCLNQEKDENQTIHVGSWGNNLGRWKLEISLTKIETILTGFDPKADTHKFYYLFLFKQGCPHLMEPGRMEGNVKVPDNLLEWDGKFSKLRSNQTVAKHCKKQNGEFHIVLFIQPKNSAENGHYLISKETFIADTSSSKKRKSDASSTDDEASTHSSTGDSQTLLQIEPSSTTTITISMHGYLELKKKIEHLEEQIQDIKKSIDQFIQVKEASPNES